jgi:hypothetical protein
MKKHLLSRKVLLIAFSVLFSILPSKTFAQNPNYNWTGAADSNFYNIANWTSTVGLVAFDNASFKEVRTSTSGISPVISQVVAWQPGIFDNLGGNLTVNADFACFYNDKLNGTVTVNTGATFVCRNIFRIGSGGSGTLNVNGGTFMSNDPSNWQGIFIGALAGGNGTANINSGGTINGGYQLEIGTRNNFPTGLLNVNANGTALAYWATVIGPNGTVNIDGGTLNAGQKLLVGDLTLDPGGIAGSVGSIVGRLNINSGSVIVNQNDLSAGDLVLHAKAKVVIDNGTLVIKASGKDFTAAINTFVTAGQIVPASGKKITVSYDGVLTTVKAIPNLGVNDFTVADNAFTVYPNPVQDVINIIPNKDFDGNLKVSIVALSGATVLEQTVEKNSGSFNLDIKNKLSSGVYLLKITSNNLVHSSKIVVK